MSLKTRGPTDTSSFSVQSNICVDVYEIYENNSQKTDQLLAKVSRIF